MLRIAYNGIKPNATEFEYSIMGNNNADVIDFSFSSLPSGTPYIKFESKDKSYVDKITATDYVSGNHIIYPLLAKTTAYKVLKCQIQVENSETEVVWQTEIIEITLKNTISADEEIENNYPTILDEALNSLEITYAKLVDLRDSGKLVAGKFYRITDYITTTTQDDTQSAGHYFDVIVRADDESHLNENCWFTHSERDIDGYFDDSKLESWQGKYCIDNDTTRFAWADEDNGTGVIYYLKDEFNNECPYDFKNIQFKRYCVGEIDSALEEIIDNWDWQPSYYLANGKNDVSHISNYDEGDYIWCYTFTTKDYDTDDLIDASLNNQTVEYEEYFAKYCYDNVIKQNKVSMEIDEGDIYSVISLNNIVFLETNEDDSAKPTKLYGNTFDINCYDMTFEGHNYLNKFGANCYGNLFFKCYSNTFGNDCHHNTFGNDCWYNTFGNDCNYNTFGNDCYYNTFGNDCWYNTFGNNCYSNTFGNNCYSNTFGNDCWYNTFGNDCNHNTLLDNAAHTKTDAYARYNIFENGVSYVDLKASTTGSGGSYLQNIKVCQGIQGTNASHKVITETRNLAYDTTYRAIGYQDKTI